MPFEVFLAVPRKPKQRTCQVTSCASYCDGILTRATQTGDIQASTVFAGEAGSVGLSRPVFGVAADHATAPRNGTGHDFCADTPLLPMTDAIDGSHIMSDDLRNPLKRARNIGSAKSGAGAWMAMQFTSYMLAALSVWFVVLVLSLVHSDYATASHRVGHPANATLMATFLVLVAWHTELGLRNTYEDYIHNHVLGFWSLMLTRVALLLMTVFALGVLIKIALLHHHA
jgi:succinate dehydrogenase / fumarate reductase membrane anchor subunit